MRRQIRFGMLLVLWCVGCGGGTPEIKAGNMPDGGNFSGVYYSPQYGTMNMIQNGSNVAGEYASDMRSGKIQGEVQGDVLKFEWTENKAMVSNRATESKGHGYFRYVVDPSSGDHVLKGEWGLGEKQVGGGPWNAYKAKGKEPKLTQKSSGGESESGESEGSSDSNDSKEGSDEDF